MTSAIQISTLDNGLRVATEPMDGVESASLGLWVGAGTRFEEPASNGVAHLLEHMAFKGTERRAARQIAEEIEAVGGHLNAYTSREQTAYYSRILADDVPLALDILSDILMNSTFEPTELERERQVILQEIGQAADTPDDIVFDHFQMTAYPDQALGRPVLGTRDTVAQMPRQAIDTYLGQTYTGPQMVLSASGKVDHEQIVRLASEVFAKLDQSPAPPPQAAQYSGGAYLEDKALEQVHVVIGLEGVGAYDPDLYALTIYSALLGGGMSSRLFQEVREERGLAYNIHSFTSIYRDSGLFAVYAGTGEGMVEELTGVICDQLLEVQTTLDDEEIERARAQLRASILMSMESTMTRCEHLAQNILTHDRPLSPAELGEKLNAVDRKSLIAVGERLLASKPTVAVLGPTNGFDAHDHVVRRLA
ncbi:MAG: pitrilysin family protein [Pseudomonadota bacterium]